MRPKREELALHALPERLENIVSLGRSIRGLLDRKGVPSNPGWTDHEVVSSLRELAGLPEIKPWGGFRSDALDLFRSVVVISLLEAGIEIGEPISKIDNLISALEKFAE